MIDTQPAPLTPVDVQAMIDAGSAFTLHVAGLYSLCADKAQSEAITDKITTDEYTDALTTCWEEAKDRLRGRNAPSN